MIEMLPIEENMGGFYRYGCPYIGCIEKRNTYLAVQVHITLVHKKEVNKMKEKMKVRVDCEFCDWEHLMEKEVPEGMDRDDIWCKLADILNDKYIEHLKDKHGVDACIDVVKELDKDERDELIEDNREFFENEVTEVKQKVKDAKI